MIVLERAGEADSSFGLNHLSQTTGKDDRTISRSFVMEHPMTARLPFVTAAALSLAGAAMAAGPAKSELRDSSVPAAPRELVLASVESKAPPPAPGTQTPAPAKHRTARVTTCRCGDPQPQDDSSESE
jgi:hypothetical protein